MPGMSLIPLVSDPLFGDGREVAVVRPASNELLAVDSLWSTGSRAIGPDLRTPVERPDRRRRLPRGTEFGP